jgi:hypothetical protein
MPVIVPSRPSSGHSGTRMRSTWKLRVMPTDSREIMARRIWRAYHDLWSVRAFQVLSMSSASPGITRSKYQ